MENAAGHCQGTVRALAGHWQGTVESLGKKHIRSPRPNKESPNPESAGQTDHWALGKRSYAGALVIAHGSLIWHRNARACASGLTCTSDLGHMAYVGNVSYLGYLGHVSYMG